MSISAIKIEKAQTRIRRLTLEEAGIYRGGPRLRGRDAECMRLDQLLEAARAGRSSVLVLRGEAGVGKSALLDHLAERSTGCTLARATGVESEIELAFAGLQQLLGQSTLAQASPLPGPQRDALRRAFGLADGPAPDRYTVGLAALSLLLRLAEDRPLVCLIDDAQWLDRESLRALSFIARRLVAEPVALVFAVRQPSSADEFDGLPELAVEGLADRDARTLLATMIPGGLDEQVRERILAEARGNPLALLELPRGLPPAELAGGFSIHDTRTLSCRIEQSFLRQLQSLPPETQRLLLIAASEPVGDVTLVLRAAARAQVEAHALIPAETAGLIEFGARVRFRHPLIRAAAYRNASVDEQRQAHAALAAVTDPELDPDRRAWHRAQSAAGPDEGVAAELERSASRAQARGGACAGAAFLQKAAELTPDPAARGTRTLAAAAAKRDAGGLESAEQLLAVASLYPLSELDRARAELLHAQIVFARTRGGDTATLLSAAATQLEPLDAELARETHLEALWATVRGGRFATGVERVVDAARASTASIPNRDARAIDLLLHSLVVRGTQGHAVAAPLIRRALEAFRREGFGRRNIGWCLLATHLASDLFEDEVSGEISVGLTTVARERGALNVLPLALSYRAIHAVFAGRFGWADELVQEAEAISTATRTVPVTDFSILTAAWRGDRPRTEQLHVAITREAAARGEGFSVEFAELAIATLYNGLGEYAQAEAALEGMLEHDRLDCSAVALPELIEASIRNDSREAAVRAFERLAGHTGLASSPWARGIEARSLALLSDGPRAEALYREAIEQLERSRIVVHHQRARLIYGEWLRREGRRVDARVELKAALEAFEEMGADAFADRTRRELMATGETVRTRTDNTRDELTPQEAQIARLAGNGLTNPEIAGQLYLSPRTVEWHLRKVFTKLDISRRSQLVHTLAASPRR